MPLPHRLRKHADYQHAYAHSARQSSRQINVFFALRPADRRSETAGPRVGLTVPKAIGKAHERNRIKRRLRVIICAHLHLLRLPVDVILHPRRSVLTAESPALESEVAEIFRRVDTAAAARNGTPFPLRPPPPPRSVKPARPRAPQPAQPTA